MNIREKTVRHLLISVSGFVQGTGFRPYIYHLARLHHQYGNVCNTASGVDIHLEGEFTRQQQFLDELERKLPPFAEIHQLEIHEQPLIHFTAFSINPSSKEGNKSWFILPDIAPCKDCLNELYNRNGRFYRYPFISCCYCGPRYSIFRQQPYDRKRTALSAFTLCPYCQSDYSNPDQRRFHAQTIACPQCGPKLTLLDRNGSPLAQREDALNLSTALLRQGKIVAIKGVGGFQLLADAADQNTIADLRLRKHRPKKPLALLVCDADAAEKLCFLSEQEQQALASPAAPIVLLQRKSKKLICPAIAPDSDLLGIMLPASPLHHLLCNDFGAPLVATSGNLSDDPICIDNADALQKLNTVADYFLVHNREILRPLDDSVVRIIAEKTTVLRRGRGYTPLPLRVNSALPPTLATGAYLKNTVAIANDHYIISSQHHGDLGNASSQRQLEKSAIELQNLYAVKPELIAHDLHPDYSSTRYAQTHRTNQLGVQHHHAHVLAVMAEHNLSPPLLGFAWDGIGLGTDFTLWGGETLLIQTDGYQRHASLLPFPLPGADSAAKEPRRAALGLLFSVFGRATFERTDLYPLQSFTAHELKMLEQTLIKQLNCPLSSSMGRLFDATASLLGLCHLNDFEGEAATQLEQLAHQSSDDQSYPFSLQQHDCMKIDWQPMLYCMLDEIGKEATKTISARFHNTLAEIILAIAGHSGQHRIALSGGCFQNACLTEKAVKKLKSAGYRVYTHEKIPPNDGGLSVGQAYATAQSVTRKP